MCIEGRLLSGIYKFRDSVGPSDRAHCAKIWNVGRERFKIGATEERSSAPSEKKASF